MAFKIQIVDKNMIGQVAQLADLYALWNVDIAHASETGFLVSRYSLSDYNEILDRSDHFYCLTDNGVLTGYILAYSNKNIDPEDWVYNRIIENFPPGLIIIKQVCIHPDFTGMGYAKLLYEHLFSMIPDLPYFAAIVIEPINTRSIMFHEHMCFSKVMETIPPDRIPRGIWRKEPGNLK